ncbi:LuxR C-terminal-related transcriptional regulator [Actinoplanes sp. NPDC049118]|uniref:response regulator transcription factor n=1 Tax=Actinoplanes sp. NPDC049118 TaxID=3155769 RepID=UPI003409E05B
MPDAIRVTVIAADPFLEAGAISTLQRGAGLTVVAPEEPATVAVIIVDTIAESTFDLIRAVRAGDHHPEVVLVATEIDAGHAHHAIAAGARGLLRRRNANADRLLRAVLAAAYGDCTVPPDTLQRLMTDEVAAPAPIGGRGFPGLSERERAVLNLLAEGHETGEIAKALAYSTRTVTSVVQDITRRFRLRNRAHAVAYALRMGLL